MIFARPLLLALLAFSTIAGVPASGAAPIIGGEVVGVESALHRVIRQYSLYLVIQNYDGSVGACSGSLIASSTVLTAAHCLRTAARVVVLSPLGESARGTEVAYVQGRDWGIMTLDRVLASTQVVTRGNPFTLKAGDELILTGWGRSISPYANDPAPALRMTRKRILTFGQDRWVMDHRIGGRACFGDSGAPVFRQSGGALEVVGIVSATLGDCSGLDIVQALLTSAFDRYGARRLLP